jgi:hypothetical protein
MLLSERNAHPRDKNIQFFEEGHKYVILPDSTSSYTSVTTWNHSHFPKFDADNIIKNMMKSKGWKPGHKYWGLTPEEIKAMWSKNTEALAGTELHYEIECFMNSDLYTNADLYKKNMPNINTRVEWQYFLNFLKDFPDLKPYRTEWTIYNEDLKIAGSIDMVYENPDGTLSIYDWKRCKNITRINTFNKFALNPIINHFPDSNFWHYALQLNTYKAILEDKYDVKISGLFLVRLHPDAEEENYELIQIPILNKEISELFLERKKEIKTI